MANYKKFSKALRFAHRHIELPIAAQLPMVISFWWEQTSELVINVKSNVIKRSPVVKRGDARLFERAVVVCLRKNNAQGALLNTFQFLR